MTRVLILGAGGHGQVVADVLAAAHQAGSPAFPLGFLDDDERLVGHTIQGLPVFGPLSALAIVEHEAAIVAIGDNRRRAALFDALVAARERLETAIHPRAILAAGVRIGAGTVICAGAIVNPEAVIGANAILNTASTVDHHCTVGDHAHLGPGVHLGGRVRIGSLALLGVGVSVAPGASVGSGAILGAGAAVVRDIPAWTIAVGVPARVISTLERPE